MLSVEEEGQGPADDRAVEWVAVWRMRTCGAGGECASSAVGVETDLPEVKMQDSQRVTCGLSWAETNKSEHERRVARWAGPTGVQEASVAE